MFLYLTGFSNTGGIEKFNRSLLKALHELSVDGVCDADAFSSYDDASDEKYFPKKRFKGFKKNRLYFLFYTLFVAFKYEQLYIGHINLAVLACWIKRLKPSIKLVTIVHGIEAWKEQTGYKKRLLERSDLILSVSQYTKDQVLQKNATISANSIQLFPNTLDPYFKLPVHFQKPAYLLQRYNLSTQDPLLLTITRLSFSEKDKGYDRVMQVLLSIKNTYPSLKYLLGGKGDEGETARIKNKIHELNLDNQVVLTGFIDDEELIDHFLLGDVFIMPSKKEGFGIVFIEALACGKIVIAGSKDGSVDALLNGELGVLVDPDSLNEIEAAILAALQNNTHVPFSLQKKVNEVFGFRQYKKRLASILQTSSAVIQ